MLKNLQCGGGACIASPVDTNGHLAVRLLQRGVQPAELGTFVTASNDCGSLVAPQLLGWDDSGVDLITITT